MQDDSSPRYRLYGGARLRALRQSHGLRQSEMAQRLGISVPYLSQLEHDGRPLTEPVQAALAAHFPQEWIAAEENETGHRIAALLEALADPLFADAAPSPSLARIAEQQPALVERFLTLHRAYHHAGQRLQILDDAITAGDDSGTRLPWEEVRDWFHSAGNYVDTLDRAAEGLATHLLRSGETISDDSLERYLRETLAISIVTQAGGAMQTGTTMRDYDAEMGHVVLDAAMPSETRRFQMAHQLVSIALRHEITDVIAASGLSSPAARQLLLAGLTNYAAGALLMPYARFARFVRSVRHDIDRIRTAFAVSFEQACHRLSTLQRPGARGIPFFFCRVDMAGNITKRHSATRLQFARFGGACPLWIVHEAVAIPDRILTQLGETPDGVRYVSMAKGLVKPSSSYARPPRRYAVALGCEITHAADFIYADGMDLTADRTATRIGISCRLCPRADCDQRAFPPSDRAIQVDPDRRGAVPYSFS